MFTTFESAAIAIPPIFDYEDERWWAYVHVPLFTPYFHMVIEYPDEDGESSWAKTLLYQDAEQVVRTADASDVTVLDIQIVLPNHEDGKGRWRMEPLAEALIGLEPDLEHKQAAYVYVLEDGTRIVESAISTPEKDLLNLQTRFKFTRKK